VDEGKIYPIEYKTVADHTYKEVPLNHTRLEKELRVSMKDINDAEPETFYWFLATEEGKKEDLANRQDRHR
jgi:hypothetical protein